MTGEVPYAKLLVASLRSPMVVLLDRAFGATDLITAITEAEAHLMVRVKDNESCRRYGGCPTARTCRRSANCGSG